MTNPTQVDPKLKQWATETQARYIDAINQYGGARGAARELGVTYSLLPRAVAAVEKKAALAGYSPDHDMFKTVPEGFSVKGTSTLYGADGELKLQWVKTKQDQEAAEQSIREWVGWLVQDARGLSPTIKPPSFVNEDLLCVYPMGDPHFGMYAWKEESGDDFDLSKAEALTKGAIDSLVASAPPAETALICELGDFFHSDNESNRTSHSGNALDVDTRWSKVMQVGLRSMVYVILAALTKHKKVLVRIVKGNHDGHSSYALALALDAWFQNEKRVTVDLSPAAHWYLEFGQCLIGTTHGDTTKMDALPGVMAADRPAEWGRTKFRYWYLGHVHHEHIKEYPGAICRTFRTLASRDAWHQGQGYRAGRDMTCLVLHKRHGEVGSHRCDISMLET